MIRPKRSPLDLEAGAEKSFGLVAPTPSSDDLGQAPGWYAGWKDAPGR